MRSRKGASNAVLTAAVNGRFEMSISVPLVLEYEAVLSRAEHLLESRLNSEDVEQLIDDICSFGIHVDMHWNWRPQTGDPDDELVIATAINGRAAAIVTFNRADFEESCRRFGIELLSPQEMLQRHQPL